MTIKVIVRTGLEIEASQDVSKVKWKKPEQSAGWQRGLKTYLSGRAWGSSSDSLGGGGTGTVTLRHFWEDGKDRRCMESGGESGLVLANRNMRKIDKLERVQGKGATSDVSGYWEMRGDAGRDEYLMRP